MSAGRGDRANARMYGTLDAEDSAPSRELSWRDFMCLGGSRGHARAQKEQLPTQRRWQRGKREQDPEEAQVAARHRVERLENALAALGESESAEAWSLNTALKEARRAARGRPLAVQGTECQGFIQRSQNRLRQMEERVVEQQTLDVALARLSRLREEMAKNPDPPPIVVSPVPTQPGVIQATGPSAEVRQLRARLAEVELERDVLVKKRARSLSVLANDITRANQSISVLGLHQGLDRRSAMMQTMIDMGKFLGCIEQLVQPIGTVNVAVPDEHVS